MIKHWIITGDTHGYVVDRLQKVANNVDDFVPSETAVVILGDAGINYYLNKTDRKHKREISEMGIRVYCVRGNHEERPEKISGIHSIYDEDVCGNVYIEDDFQNIRYFEDGGVYNLGGRSVLTIGGAYSVDKFWRLERAIYGGYSGWFESEQLTGEEMASIEANVAGKHFDLVLTHTAPIDWEPSDLFIGGIDQSKVDKTMEIWLGRLKDKFTWGIWLFGHFHADRVEAPHVEQIFEEYEDINDILSRWSKYDETKELDWWIPRSPRMK